MGAGIIILGIRRRRSGFYFGDLGQSWKKF